MNNQYSQTRRNSVLYNLKLFNMSPDDIFSHRGPENRYLWSSDELDNPARQIIKERKLARKTRGIKHYSSKVEPKLISTSEIRPEISHEHAINFDQLNTEEEFDIFIKMPPVKERTARIKIKKIENATMRVVEP